jgi:hypothetical protein
MGTDRSMALGKPSSHWPMSTTRGQACGFLLLSEFGMKTRPLGKLATVAEKETSKDHKQICHIIQLYNLWIRLFVPMNNDLRVKVPCSLWVCHGLRVLFFNSQPVGQSISRSVSQLMVAKIVEVKYEQQKNSIESLMHRSACIRITIKSLDLLEQRSVAGYCYHVLDV